MQTDGVRMLQEDGSENADVWSCEHAWGVFKKQEAASEVGQRGRDGGWVWRTGLGMNGWRSVHNEMRSSFQKEGNPAVCDNKDEHGEHYAK